MLSRLDDSFLRLSGFSADIAHELRTPLNSMLTQMEVALLRDRENTDYKDILYSALEELRRMSKMVDDMLFLAKARSEEHTSELQSLMRISYAVFCLKKKKQIPNKPKQVSPKHSQHEPDRSI